MRGQTEKGRNAEQLFSDKVTLSEATLGTGRVLIESVTRSLTPMGLDLGMELESLKVQLPSPLV